MTKLCDRMKPAARVRECSRIQKCCLVLCAAVSLIFSTFAAQAEAQTPAKLGRRAAQRVIPAPASSSSAAKVQRAAVRARRAAQALEKEVKSDEAAPQEAVTEGKIEAPAATEATTEAATDATTDVTTPDEVSPVPETLDVLRAEIAGAKSDAERGRLERRFVERLVSDAPPDEALGELRRLLDGTRFDPPFYYNVGNHLARLGDAGAAATAYRKAIQQRHGNYSRALNNLGVVLLRIGNPTEAEQAFLKALRQENFTYAEAHYNLGRLYHARGESKLAVRHLRRALRLEPTHAPAALLLAAEGNKP